MAGGATRRRGVIAEINVTPLVDIMLVLLIIFMLTAHLIAKRAIELELPRASQSTTAQPTTLAISLARDGAIYLNGAPTNPVALRAAVSAEVAKDPKHPPQVMIAGDKGVSLGRAIWVIDTIKRLGIDSIAFQIDPTQLVAPDAR
jgi:biopolymer transport protein ExbD